MKKIILALYLLTLWSLPVPNLFAQDAVSPQSIIQSADELGDATFDETVVLLADVNVTDVQVEEVAGVLTGSFALQGKMGQQSDIVYGISVITSEGIIFAVEPLGTLSALLEAELKVIPFTYTLPSGLYGTVQVLVVAETAQGLPLGTQIIFEQTYPTGEPSIMCEYRGQYSSPACTVKAGGDYTVRYYQGSLFAEPALTETVRFEAGVATPLFPELPAGTYTVLINGNGNREMVRTSFNRAGEYGTILNAVVSKDAAGLATLTATLQSNVREGGTFTYELTAEGSTSCGSGSLPVTGVVVTTTLTSTCASGMLTTSLVDPEGQVLDTRTDEFSVLPFVPEDTAVESTIPSVLLLGGIVLIILLLFVIYRLYRDSRESHIVASLVFLGIVFLGGTNTAEAATFYIHSWYNGEISHMVLTTVTPDKSSYAPGENITFSSTAEFNHDAYGVGQYLRFTIGYRSDSFNVPTYSTPFTPSTQPAPAFSGVFGPGNSLNHPYVQPFTVNDSITFPAPTAPGNYYLAFRALLQSFTCYSNCIEYDNNALIRNVSFTVAPVPSACTVQVNTAANTQTYSEGDPEFSDYWNNFARPDIEFTAIGFAGATRYRACGTSGGCSTYGEWSFAPATRRPTVPASCAAFASNPIPPTPPPPPPTPPTVACEPAGSFYTWNGINWDDYMSPSWSPNQLSPSYNMSFQGQLLSGPIGEVAGTVSGVEAFALSYPSRATRLRCTGAAPTPSVNLQFKP